MSTPVPSRRLHPARASGSFPFRRTPLASIVTVLVLLASAPAHAADSRSVAELEAEIARLQQEIAAKSRSGASAVTPKTTTGEPEVSESAKTLDTVVVRSRHRLERLKDVPISVAVVTGSELTREATADLEGVTKRIANFAWNPGNARTSSLSIRGLGKQAQTDAMDPSVGLNVDGIAYGYNPLSSFDLFDVDTVEVLRGPQGTLFGRNANLGVLKITNKRPTFNPEAEYSVGFGQGQRLTAQGAVGGAIVDDVLAWRGSFRVDRGAGYVKNAEKGYLESTFGNSDRVAGRVQFLLTPNADFNARLSLEMTPTTGEAFNGKTIYTPTPLTYANGSPNNLNSDASTRLGRRWFGQLPGYTYAGSYLYGGGRRNTVNLDHQTPTYTDTKGGLLEMNWNVAEHTLTSLTAYKDFRFQVRNDEGTPFDITKRGGGHVDKFSQFSQELRIASKLGGFVDYQGGLHFQSISNRYDSNAGFGSDAGAWFANASQYNQLDASGTGRDLMQNALNELVVSPLQKIESKSLAVFGQANWHLSEPLTVTTGVRLTREDRRNTTSRLIVQEGYGAGLNPVSVNGVQLGGFNSNATTGALLAGNSAAQQTLADLTASRYFGVSSYSALSANQLREIANAKALRRSNIGVLWNETQAESIKKVHPTLLLSPRYKVNENLTTYFSAQYGEKAGIAQLTNGEYNNAKPERTASLEVGFKSSLLNQSLVLNANLYHMKIRDYQQAVQVFDKYNTDLNPANGDQYTSATGNVPKVKAQGLELDATYSGWRNLLVRFSGAYNDARYEEFTNAAKPVELNYLADKYLDMSGKTLPGASKFTFSVGAEYRKQVFGDKEFHTSFNTYYASKFNSDNTLSSYGWVDGTAKTDIAIGLGKADKSFDVNLIVKNAFNDTTPQARTWNSYVPSAPRWVGVVFTGKL